MSFRPPRRNTRLRPPPSSPDAQARISSAASRRDTVLADIAREEAKLADLERSLEGSRARLVQLRAELDSISPLSRTTEAIAQAAPLSAPEKVRLFRSLFRGREDVFPIRFVSKRTGKPGYAPVCSNKWKPDVCILKTGGKCMDCPHQSFVPVDDLLIRGHLEGRHTMGVYPLLEDETCWFLAADFDERSWQKDALAFTETCRALEIPAAIERSRSGEGAHVWIFFAERISAVLARKMGSTLMTETMSRRHELSMSSYDRLFPNQDTLPRGGFGNLIALPLQYEPRQRGNSVFVDDEFIPHRDQWAYLASLRRMERRSVEAIVRERVRHDPAHAARLGGADEPWALQAAEVEPAEAVEGPFPARVKGTLAQRLFIEKAGLSSRMLNRLKRIAAFQNPEFYKRQRLRLSTALTPRIIACAEDLESHIALPRGSTAEAERLFAEWGVEFPIDDRRDEGRPAAFEFRGDLSSLQKQGAKALLEHDHGIFVGPPGVGKTVLGAYLIAKRARSALVLVHRKPLLEQWALQLAIFLGIDEKEIGQIGGGKRQPNGKLDVAMIQSLSRRGKVDDIVKDYGHVIVDECHHLPASSFERVLSEVRARYILGLTATPERRDGHQPIMEMQLGPVRFRVDSKAHAARGRFEHKLVVRETGFRMNHADAKIQEAYRAIANDQRRNEQIVNDAVSLIEEGRSPIVLTERRDHLEDLANRLRPLIRHVVVLRGGLSEKERRQRMAELASIPESEERVVLATGRYIGEGFDDARLDTLLLTMPIAWKGNIVQYAGRLHRRHHAKREVRIYDYVDSRVPVLSRMFEKRLSAYRAMGYVLEEGRAGDDVSEGRQGWLEGVE